MLPRGFFICFDLFFRNLRRDKVGEKMIKLNDKLCAEEEHRVLEHKK